MTTDSMIRLGVPTVLDANKNTVPDPEVLFSNLVSVVHQVTEDLLHHHYNTASLTQLAQGVDTQGKTLPSTAAAAADRLGWRPAWKVSNSRILKMGQSNAISILKGQAWRLVLFNALLPIIPPRDQLYYNQRSLQKITIGLAVDLNRYQDEVTIRAMVRSVLRYYDEFGKYPATYFELFPNPPSAPHLANLGAVDKQYATRVVERVNGTLLYVLSTLLPSIQNNAWVYKPYTVSFPVPKCYFERVTAVLADPLASVTLPVFRLDKQEKLHITTTLQETVPPVPIDMDTITGVDLNRDKMLTATVVKYNPETDTYTHDAYVHTFDALGLFAKTLRLQNNQDEISSKIHRLLNLCKNNTDPKQCQKLEKHIQALQTERDRINAKRSRISIEISHDAAAWVQTINDIYGATGVFFENLRSLPIAFDKYTNRVLSQLPRGKILAYTQHKMTRLGVGAKTVPPATTSSLCPYCLGKLTHPKGYSTAVCTTCLAQDHRDDLSPVRIAQKGHAKHVRKRKPAEKGKKLNHKVTKLAKTGPTPKQVKNKYRKKRHRVKTNSYQKPLHFREPRVLSDTCVPHKEHVQQQVGVPWHTAEFY